MNMRSKPEKKKAEYDKSLIIYIKLEFPFDPNILFLFSIIRVCYLVFFEDLTINLATSSSCL